MDNINEEIFCPRCNSTRIKKNGLIHNGKQNYKCLESNCMRQFVLNPTKKYIKDTEKELIKKLLLERISLEGICRVMDVSMPWLLRFLKETYEAVPNDLNVVINMEEVEQYPDEQLDEKIYSLLEKKTRKF
jgi:transposase-like protein